MARFLKEIETQFTGSRDSETAGFLSATRKNMPILRPRPQRVVQGCSRDA